MNIQKITASVRYSAALPDGQHKTLELGAEALLQPGDSWEQSQAALYKALGAQLRTLWASNGTPHAAPTPQAVQDRPTSAPAPTVPAHYCKAHGKPHQRHEKGGKVWYSHKAPDGSWCNEDQARKAAA